MIKNMASTLPSPTKVAGKHSPIYEAYYKQIDPKGTGTIEALTAAKFLKKSGLSDVVLSRIWDLSDPSGRGYLDKAGMFVALKLVALAQAGDVINMSNIFIEPPNPPKVGEIPKIMPPKIQSVPPTSDDWSIKPIDKLKYEELFESLKPVDGLIPGNKVRGVLMDSKLPLDALSKIWDLADQDKDGSLDKHEFIVAMHLVYQALDKRAIPHTLPLELQRASQKSSNIGIDNGFIANFPTDIAPPPPVPPLPAVKSNIPPAIPPMPRITNQIPSVTAMQPLMTTDLLGDSLLVSPPSVDWVVSTAERTRFDAIFAKSDLDKDGLVSGLEIKDIFIQSGIPQMCLAQIWALCDTNQSGKLTSEQFALAMWLVERKKNGIEPPNVLAPNMIPPSFRTSSSSSPSMGISSLIGEPIVPMQPVEQPRQAYANPELEMISKEIEELAKERRLLENDVAQKEADIRIKSGEVRSLQSELDTLVATLKQLETQKGEAQKRLNDLKAQQNDIDENVCSVNIDIEETQDKVTKIREQCQKQEETIREQESELDSKRSELQKLKDEESSLELEYEENKRVLEKLSKNLQDTQLQICQIKSLVTQLEESQRQMNDALAVCKAAIEANNPGTASYFSLKFEPDFREAKIALQDKSQPANDPFNDKANGFSIETSTNEFKTDKFATTFDDNSGSFGIDRFASATAGFDDGFGGNSFSHKTANDPFAGANSTAANDPFGDKKGLNAVTPDPNKDDFGSDPFAILHAPTSASQIISPGSSLGTKSIPPQRPESPSPALPPKKSKQPPPRPAPPRPSQGPTITKPDSGFGNTTSGSGFADFADFENKNCGLSDFTEDPFKDYRYEDPFSIQDPFADEETFPSIELTSQKTDINISVQNNNKNDKVITSKKKENFNNNTDNNLNNRNIELSSKSKLNINDNPINNNINNNLSKNKYNTIESKNENTRSKSMICGDRGDGDGNNVIDGATANFANFDGFVTNETDFFAAFNENINKISRYNHGITDAFGMGFNSTAITDEDSTAADNNNGRFLGSLSNTSVNNNTTSTINDTTILTKRLSLTNNNTENNNFTDNITDNFDDKFTSFMTKDTHHRSINDKNHHNNNNNVNINKISNSSSPKLNNQFGFDDDDNDEFTSFGTNAFNAFKTSTTINQSPSRIAAAFVSNPTTSKTAPKKLKPIQSADFAKLTVAADKEKRLSGDGGVDEIKIPIKFATDFSKNDQFDVDLQEVLKRSLVDQ